VLAECFVGDDCWVFGNGDGDGGDDCGDYGGFAAVFDSWRWFGAGDCLLDWRAEAATGFIGGSSGFCWIWGFGVWDERWGGFFRRWWDGVRWDYGGKLYGYGDREFVSVTVN
jgi:hypothetical protein